MNAYEQIKRVVTIDVYPKFSQLLLSVHMQIEGKVGTEVSHRTLSLIEKVVDRTNVKVRDQVRNQIRDRVWDQGT